jgi:DNA polymerase-3 subunit epsilon
MRYLAIDFETANCERSSICAFGYALFEDGQVIAAGADLCRPIPNYYEPMTIHIHGIRKADTEYLGGFEEHINKIDSFAPDFIVAHNAAFDISCLRKWCDLSGRKYPTYPYVCTVKIAKALHPNMSHTLNEMCQHYSIPLNHHEAGSDALACGHLLDIALKHTGAKTMTDLCKQLYLQPGCLLENDYKPCSVAKARRVKA